MFQSARMKLTAWYLLMIMLISGLFSCVIYANVSHQLEGFVRIQNERLRIFQNGLRHDTTPPPNLPPILSNLDLKTQQERLLFTLILINLGILMISGGAGYFLAGRTLLPIKEMLDEQNQFISDASHELRTPIATMRAEMESRLLEKHINEKQARQLISSNLEELSTLQNLANNLLRLTGIKSNHKNDNNYQTDFWEVRDMVISKVLPQTKKKKIKIIKSGKNAKVMMSQDELGELLIIMIDNAIKYSSVGTNININSEIGPGKISISITDQGIGIDTEDIPHIFERFYRADKSRSLTEGYGLGLAIAKNITEQNHGSISVRSVINKGSTFVIVLPTVK